jgi:hypothetical protein
MKGVKKKIYPPKFALFVGAPSPGVKSGKKYGKMLNIVAINVAKGDNSP